MDDDLIKRLLVRIPDPARAYKSDDTIPRNPDGKAAAARIAELEAENARLREIAEAAKHVRALDEDEFEVIVGNCAYHNLRAALNKR